ncbi:MAG: type I restriction endonuclease subunit R [Planctomycetes bacterium]|nr:type I restriction endonuclease subunit R [Planctomycetota bacterium]
MTPAGYKEINFEDAVERDLLQSGGYAQGSTKGFDRTLALFPSEVLAWIESSQPDLWAQLRKDHGAKLDAGVIQSLTKTLAQRGALDVLRHGFKHYGKKIDMAVFKPAHGLNPEVERRYSANRLVVTRQLKFNPQSEESLDIVLSLNGLPVVTMELKNSLTGQTVSNAIRQYKNDRDPRLPIFRFKERALVHFAVDTDEVFMTTRLDGKTTRFLPFNRGVDGGAGNPPAEPYKTAYLWREVLARDSLLDILARFMHLEVKEEGEGAKRRKKEALIFPRYHQLDVVRRLIRSCREEGAGEHYLVQHSAGSGKSNSIAWTAHRLASLHDAGDRKLFDSVIVITDRRVLDKQLQDTIYQFEHKQGVVARIDKNSNQLAEALQDGTAIVITTLQKFPFVAEKVADLPDRRYAVIVDEAHSSQTGESARALRGVLGANAKPEPATMVAEPGGTEAQEDEPSHEDEINRIMESRGRQPNLSFFAFTATPKAKTLEVFGRSGPDGRPLPFHTYTMRQAIEEGFILDVLKNYTTYQTYYRLVQKAAEDKEVKKAEATRALARFMSLHPHNIAQKVEVIVEHFRAHVRHRLGGQAKAMVVTRSRLHAVRFKLAFDHYVEEQGYHDLRALVAFSGSVIDPDGPKEPFTEVGMNDGIQEKELPEKFSSAAYQVLLVANKYQTGFDQPLLCAMYVDKKLSGVQAVQTLSRLNRMYPGKDDVFVLDFANSGEEIQSAFQPFYQQTTVSERADPNQLEALRHELDSAQVWHASEVEAFAKVFYRPKEKLTDKEHAELHFHLQPAVDRFVHIEDEEEREKWRGKLQSFVNLYAFLSQVMPWTDRDLEIRYSFGRLLLKRLPREQDGRYDPEGEVDLHFYRLARKGESSIVLAREDGDVKGPTDVGTRKEEDPTVPLSEIIETLNDRFGTEFTEADRLLLDQVIEDGKADAGVVERAKANSFDNFALSIRSTIQDLMIDRLDRNQGIVSKFLDEEDFKRVVSEHVARRIFEDVQEQAS